MNATDACFWKKKNRSLTAQLDPQIVSIEDLERFNRLEVVDMLLWHLGDFQQPHFPVVFDERATLQIPGIEKPKRRSSSFAIVGKTEPQ